MRRSQRGLWSGQQPTHSRINTDFNAQLDHLPAAPWLGHLHLPAIPRLGHLHLPAIPWLGQHLANPIHNFPPFQNQFNSQRGLTDPIHSQYSFSPFRNQFNSQRSLTDPRPTRSWNKHRSWIDPRPTRSRNKLHRRNAYSWTRSGGLVAVCPSRIERGRA